jgi:DNA-directed RNA polymerase specialized sigma subunit
VGLKITETTVLPKETTMNLNLDLTAVDRERALRTWLVFHGMDLFEIAAKLRVAHSTVSRLIKRDRASMRRVEQLHNLGIPRELLPVPK